MSGNITIGDGTKEEWIRAVDEMYKQQNYFTSYDDFDVYKKACGDNGYRFLVAKTEEGQFVGCVTLAVSPGDYAVLDNYFVLPQFRGGGRGHALFEALCNDSARNKYNLALHSESSLSDYYAKHGFTIKLDYKIHVLNLFNFKKISTDNHHLSILEKPTEVERNDFYDYDAKVWRHPRKAFLSVWLQRTDARVLAAQTGNGVTVGYGVLREACSPGRYILGPLYADNEAALAPLMQAFLDGLKSIDIVQVRVPSINVQKFQQALESRATIDFQSEYIPQYTKSSPDLDPQYVYSITDFSAPL